MQPAVGLRKWLIVWTAIIIVPVAVAIISNISISQRARKTLADVAYTISAIVPPAAAPVAPPPAPIVITRTVTVTSDVHVAPLEFFQGQNTLGSALSARDPVWQRGFKPIPPTNFSPDVLAKPEPEMLATWKREHNLIRLAPYPFFSILSIPNDGCSQTPATPLFINQLLSRKYGLDFANSFHPFANVLGRDGIENFDPTANHYPRLVMFSGDKTDPMHFTYENNDQEADSLALLLTYYYRGWVDHIHDWSDGSGWYFSLVIPRDFDLEKDDGKRHQLDVHSPGLSDVYDSGHSCAEAFAVELHADGELDGFELTLRDDNGYAHYIVYNSPLGERQGWDVSNLDKSQLKQFFVKMIDEKNVKRKYASTILNGPLKAADIKFHGGHGKVALKGVRSICLTREMVQAQMESMRKLNVLPLVCTQHGGVDNFWTCIDSLEWDYKFPYPNSPDVYHSRVYPWGQVPTSPTYVADLYRDFGLLVHGQTTGQVGANTADLLFPVWTGPDDHRNYYHFFRTMGDANDPEYPSWQETTADTLGETIARIVGRYKTYGQDDAIYTHYSYYSGNAFEGPKGLYFLEHAQKLTPNAETALEALTNMKFDLDGKRPFHQRMWCAPISTNARFSMALRQLPEHTIVSGDNVIRITPWTDPVSGKLAPDLEFVTQDLHGQTFYVADSKTAQVFVDDEEITSLKRNPADFTGRQSVTIVDTCTPKVVFDEVEPGGAKNGHRVLLNADYSFRDEGAAVGQHCLKVKAIKPGDSVVTWMPCKIDSHETDYVHFYYRKSNPKSRIVLGWSQSASEPRAYAEPNSPNQPFPKLFKASDADLQGHQGWVLPHFEDTDYHEVVLDFADMVHPNTQFKGIPRGEVISTGFGLVDAAAGDTVWFDSVEFLAARGVRPHCGKGLVVGGCLKTRADGETVVLRIDGQPDQQCQTVNGGWYMFGNVPVGAIMEMDVAPSDGKKWTLERFHPLQGKRIEAKSNSMEYWIHFF